jgi:hypothetical protein
MRTTLEHSRLGLAAAITGPVVSVGVAWATSSVGADSDERLTLANVALLLAGITAAAHHLARRGVVVELVPHRAGADLSHHLS